MKTQFCVRGYTALSESDNFENGCHGASSRDSADSREFTLYADSFVELKDCLKDFTKVESDEDILLNSCEEMGRLDIQVWQREAFNRAKLSEPTRLKWQSGEIDLWLTCYTFQVERIEIEIDLTLL